MRKNIERHRKDGLDPVARRQIKQLRKDIARAYQWKGVATRMAGGAAVAAATAAVVALVVQTASDGEVDVAAVGEAAGQEALLGGGGALADTGLYHIGTRYLDLTPEAAKAFAQNGVAAGFCLIAIGTDLLDEVSATRAGAISAADAVAGSSMKATFDILPLVLAPLGFAGVPVLIGAQLAGRWAIAKVREADRKIQLAAEENLRRVTGLHARLDRLEAGFEQARFDCEDTDRLYASVMSGGDRLHVSLPEAVGPEDADDARDTETNVGYANCVTRLLRELTEDPANRILACLAGGRKAMSFYMGYVMSLLGRADDDLRHVLVSPAFENSREFWWKPIGDQAVNLPPKLYALYRMLAEWRRDSVKGAGPDGVGPDYEGWLTRVDIEDHDNEEGFDYIKRRRICIHKEGRNLGRFGLVFEPRQIEVISD